MSLLECVLLGVLAQPAPAGGEKGAVIELHKDHIDLKVGDKLVSRYHIAASQAKPFLWPLNAPNGMPLTRAWPMEPAPEGGTKDHVHQKSAWFCHGDVLPEGVELKHKIRGVDGVDFWSEAKGHGKMVCTRVGTPRRDPKHPDRASIDTTNEWRTADGVKILDEKRTLTLYDLGKAYLIVFDIDLQASGGPVVFEDTKEGAMGVRVRDELRVQKGNGTITNAAGGCNEKECWGKLSAWCDYSGTLFKQTAGIAIFDDPKNPYPACWHSRDYGLMSANPFGRAKSKFPEMKGRTDLVRLGKGEHLRLRYGILLHDGDAASGQVADLYQRFVKLRAEEGR
jgi:hypothetical protein